jgi:large repetitive protein
MHTQRLVLWPSVIVGAILALMMATAVSAAAPAVTYSASGSTPFSTLTVGGSGFQPGETVSISIGLNTTTAAANGSGSFSGATLAIPNVPSGLYYIIAVGQTSGMVAFNSVWVNSFFPNASPSGWYVMPGSTITWSGTGFVPNESVTIKDSTNTTIATFSANASGGFSGVGSTVIPFSAANSTVTYTLQGAQSGANTTYILAVGSLYPNGNPSTWYATPGTSVTFSGTGFAGGEQVQLFVGTSTTPIASATADSSGAFMGMGPTTLPFGSVANYKLKGVSSGAIATVPITLAGFYPSITPSSYYSAPGGILSLAGSGFAPNEQVQVSLGTNTQTVTANSMGAFNISSVQAPSTPNMPAAISGLGLSSGASTNFNISIGQYYPSITPSMWFGYGGDSVTMSGSGFAPNETITISGAATGTVTTNSMGEFSGFTTTLPNSNANYTFTGSSSITPFNFSIALGTRFSSIWFDTYWANGGVPLKVFGGGFRAGETVNLTYGAGNTALTSVVADGSGNFTANTTIPFAPAGDLTINARGASSGSPASATLTVAPVWTDFHLGSYAVDAGTAVNLIGSGYLPNEMITITTNKTTGAQTTFSTDASGSFNTNWTLPSDIVPSGGSLVTITATSAHSFDTKSVDFWVGRP